MTYRKLFKHKRKPRKETSAFSKNTEKVVHTRKDGSYTTQSHLSGKYTDYNKKGKVVRSRR